MFKEPLTANSIDLKYESEDRWTGEMKECMERDT